MKPALFAAACAACLAVASAAQALTTITFEGDASGLVADGFASGGFPQIEFGAALGEGLEVGDFGVQSDGQGLLARNDTNGNYITGRFTDGSHSYLSMDLGNDDAFFTVPGDRAVLTVYLGATLVGSTFVVFNRDDVMNQTIGFMFGPFDNFTLAYTNAAGDPFTGGPGTNVGLIEVIDNVTFDEVGGVPEPSAWAMMIMGFGGVGALMRRRRAIAAG